MITETQRTRRQSGIFASDVARIMTGDGVSVALEKLGLDEDRQIGLLPAVRLGNLLEGVVLNEFERKTGLALRRSPDTLLHPMNPWLGCHLDADTTDP